MALTEEKALASVNVIVEASTIEVKWLNRIKRDGEVISLFPFRCCYGQDQKDQFIADLENSDNGGTPGQAAPYIAAVGW